MARVDELRSLIGIADNWDTADLDNAFNLSNTFFDDVTDFLHKYGVPCAEKPTLPTQELITFGFKHLHEELKEVEQAFVDNDLVAVADGLTDMVYVALNFAARIGIPFNDVWDAVHKANMEGKRKVKDASESKRGYEHDVIKDHNFVPPEGDIHEALIKAGW